MLGTPYVAHQFEVLDGLRGIAALCVFFYHAGSHVFAANGFLAVDFFFILSGFVVAYSYRARLLDGRMSFNDFVVRRLIRLYPMVLAGVVLGILALVGHNVSNPAQAYAREDLLGWSISGLFVLPYAWANPFLDAAFPINVVLWSLFLELIANAVYAFGLYRLHWIGLAALAAIGLSLVVLIGPMDGGGSLPTFGIGFARVTAGFASGLLIFEVFRRYRPRVLRMGLFWASVPLIAITLLPPVKNAAWLPLIYLVFVSIVFLAANMHAMNNKERQLCKTLGIISYPLYLLHRPLTTMTIGLGKRFIDLTPTTYPYFISAALVISIIVSLLAVSFYETPMRRALASWRRSIARRSAWRHDVIGPGGNVAPTE